ncbi:MAG: glycosyltransferase family 4 protein [Clostridium sp.]
MKHICFFSGDITNSGGTERVASIIANELSKNKNYKVSFVSLVEKRKAPFFEINSKIKKYKLYDESVRGITHIVQTCNRLKKVMKNENIDILIDIDGILDMYSLVVKLFTKVKVISWEHFNYYQHPNVKYRKYTRKLAGRFANAIVTLTNEDKGYYEKNIKIKCPIEFIHNPIMNLDKNYNYDLNSKIILSVGRLTYQKGFDILLDVANIVLKKHKDWKWIILGEGEDRIILEDKIKSLALEEKVILKGNVSNVEAYYKTSSIFVLTSRYEGLPMTLLETKPFKLPIVSFDIKTGPNECILNNKNGYLIKAFDVKEMAEKINNLIENKELRKSFSNNALEDTEKFNLKNIIKKWTDILESI